MKCPVLLARNEELDDLGRMVDDAIGGSGRLVFLRGDAGVGKSRLVDAAARAARERGAAVLSGRAARSSTPTPLRPFGEAMLAWLREHELPQHPALAPFRPSLARLAPQLGVDPAGEQGTSLLLLGEGLLRLGTHLPGTATVLVLEDLHWADPETLAVVEYLGDNLENVPMLVIATVRTEESGSVDEVADALANRGAARIVGLRSLDVTAVRGLVAACLDDAPPVGVAEFVAEHCQGLPLLAEEQLAGLISTGALVRGDAGWQASTPFQPGIPPSLARNVEQRLERLSPSARRFADAASVLGAEFDWRLVARALGSAEVEALSQLRGLVEQQLVVASEDAFAFGHALVREIVRGTLLVPEQRALAGLLASAAAGGDSVDDAVLAELLSQAGRREEAAGAWLAAARDAIRRGALATAREMLARAEEAAEPDSDAATEIAGALVEVWSFAGEVEPALAAGRALLARLEATGAPAAEREEVAVRLARAAVTGARYDEAARLLETVRSPGLRPAADVLGAWVEYGNARFDAAVARARAALAALGPAADQLACEAWEVIGTVERGRDVVAAEVAFEEGYRSADVLGSDHWRSRLLSGLVSVELAGRRPREERFVAARDAALASGAVATAARLELDLNVLRLREFDLERAMLAADASVAQLARLRLPLHGPALLLRAFGHGLAGREAEMERDLAAGKAVDPDDVVVRAGEHGHVRAPVALARGRYELARTEFATAMDLYRAHPGQLFSMRGIWALLETALGDGDAGERARAEVRAGEQASSPHNWFALQFAEAVAAGRRGQGEEAARLFADADWTQPGPLPWMEAHLRIVVAREAARDGWGEPQTWFRQGLERLVELGQSEGAAACRALMREAGVAVPRRMPGSDRVPAHLSRIGVTAREFEVLELVVSGLSNQAIADRLVLSVRTVEVHVARLLQRTGARGRADLAAHLAR